MDTGVISAAFGALTQERRFEVIANNLANAATEGFKRDRISFGDLLRPPLATPAPPAKPQAAAPALVPVGFGPHWGGSQVRVAGVAPDLSQGELFGTGNPLDLAIEGSGFFKLETPQGLRYTRRGSFTRGQDGTLVSQEGFPVLGSKGSKITVPRGELSVSSDGTLSVAGEPVGQLELAQFPEGAPLQKEGDCLFAASGDPGPPKLPYAVRQGMLEMSNVNVIEEMIAMIEALRRYESHQRVLQAYGQMDARSVEIAELR
jgi:flagellar basal-body rod protein FlgF